MACTSSPISGACTTRVVSAMAATSTSLWPVPTVSRKTSGKPHGVEDGGGRHRRRRQTADVAAGRHGSDEDVRVAGVLLHPHPIAEDRAAGDRGWMDRPR